MALSSHNIQSNTLGGLLAHASIEVTAREPAIAGTLHRDFPPGTDVHVTFLPGDDPRSGEDTCIRLRKAGYNPIPHLTARNFADCDALDRHLTRLSVEAGVVRALVIAGDVDKPCGEFAASIDLMRTGLLEKHGIRSLLFAGHPEGHPAVEKPVLDSALREKIAFAQERGLRAEIVTQFCFEAEPIAAWLRHIRMLGIDVPVRIGVAGPAGTAMLLKFAVRCGIGNSLRTLRKRANTVGKLIGDTNPGELLHELALSIGANGLGPISGIHVYMFGGTHKTSEWLSEARRQAAMSGADSAKLRSAGV